MDPYSHAQNTAFTTFLPLIHGLHFISLISFPVNIPVFFSSSSLFVPSEYRSCQSAQARGIAFCQDAPFVLEQRQISYAGLAFHISCTPLYGVVKSLCSFGRCDVVREQSGCCGK